MRISYPPVLTDRVAKDLISKLLVRETTSRLGCMHHGHQDIKDHPWFEGVDWSCLSSKQVTAPWKPTIRSDQDTSNFDECVLCSALLLPPPLLLSACTTTHCRFTTLRSSSSPTYSYDEEEDLMPFTDDGSNWASAF